MDANSPTQLLDSARGWVVVAAAMVGVALGLSPLPFYTIGMFAPELSREFGWSFASLMGSLAVLSIVVMGSSPLAGFAVDRYGARRVAIISMFLFGLTFMSLSLSGGSIWVYYGQWVIMSVVGAGTLSGTWTRVVNGWFDKHRGLALGVASCGTGITGFLIKPFAAYLIQDHGWRVAFVVIGMLPILIGIPIVAWLFREPTEVAARSSLSEDVPQADTEEGMTLRDALRSRTFWIMAGAFLLISFALTAPTPNLENILRNHDFAIGTIAKITASFGLAVIVGRVIGGWLLDRIWAPLCALFVLILPACGSWLLSQGSLTETSAMASVIAIGLGAGFEFDLLAYLISRYFGRLHYGSIYGTFYTVIALGGGMGPVVYGYAFDRLGNYVAALTSGAACLVAGALLLLLLGPYPKAGELRARGRLPLSER